MAETKIAVIKTGWSDFVGSPVKAAHKHVIDHADGHEKYNFRPGPDGRFYAYTPPVGPHEVAPQPKELDGWLVFAVAKDPERPGLYLTGWYEKASFLGAYETRPEYASRRSDLPLDDNDMAFSYTLSSDTAVQIDPDQDPHVFAGDHMKRSPVYYLRGNGAKAAWCEALAKELLAIRRSYQRNAKKAPRTARNNRGGICSDPEKRKEVEKAAIAAVYERYPEPHYEIVNYEKKNEGFDLLVRSRSTKEEFHIEVKGTQNKSAHFLMSSNEYRYMLSNPRNWRLAMVTNALSKNSRVLDIMDAQTAKAKFFWEEFTWHATLNR